MKSYVIFACCILAMALGIQHVAAQNVPLAQLKPRSGNFTLVTDAKFGGVAQPNSYTLEKTWAAPYTEFTLDKQYDWFMCTIGMDDCADTGANTIVNIRLDGKEMLRFDQIIVFEPGKPVKLEVKDAVRMSIGIQDNFYSNKRILIINPVLVKGDTPQQFTCQQCGQQFTSQAALSDHIVAVHGPGGGGGPATFVVDPNDLDKLATALRKRVDGKPDLQAKLANGFMAVMTFNLIGIPSPDVAQNVAEDITTRLINSDFQLVERGQLDKALKELKIQDSALIDQATAQKLGQVTGCAYILVGSVSDRGQFIVMNARILETATGKAVAAESVECRKIPIQR